MRIHPEAGVVVGLTNAGQGKRTFWHSIEPHLANSETNPNGVAVQVIGQEDGGLLTRGVWTGIGSIYKHAGREGRFQDWYGRKRVSGTKGSGGQMLTSLANRELVRVLPSDKPFLTLHGLWGKGADRFYAEGDVWPEVLAADPKTIAFVPLEETKSTLSEMGDTGEIVVAGFIVPNTLLDPERRRERLDKFSEAGPDPENPLRIAYLMTGQIAHMEPLHRNVLEDPIVRQWISEGRLKLDIYMWNGKKQSGEVYRHAKALGYDPTIVTKYRPDLTTGVQIFYNSDPDEAVSTSIAMANAADLIVTPLGERVGWSGNHAGNPPSPS